MNEKIIDLTFPIYEGMPKFAAYWHPSVKITKIGCHTSEGRETRRVVLGTHTGTHIDAPLHFIAKGKPVDKIPLKICVGPAVLISFDSKHKKEITARDLASKLSAFSKIERLIVRFDWSKKWQKAAYYKEYPYFSKDACFWLVKKGIKLLGMDTPSPDNPRNNKKSKKDSPNHKYFLGKGIVLIEYLCNLNKLKSPQIFLIAMPLRIRGADGSPARVIAYDL